MVQMIRKNERSLIKGVRRTILTMCMPGMQDANFDCSSTGFALQAMDSSHVSLIHMQVWPLHLSIKVPSCSVGNRPHIPHMLGCSLTFGMTCDHDASSARMVVQQQLVQHEEASQTHDATNRVETRACLQLRLCSSKHLMLQVQCRLQQ